MRATYVSQPGSIGLVEVEKPGMQPGRVLVSRQVISLCGSDLHCVYYSPPDEYPLPVGVSGHEYVGIVEESDQDRFRPGDRVLVHVADLTGLADYRLTRPDDLIPLPDEGDPEHLVMAQPLGTVLWACTRLENIIGQDAVVLGQGALGLLFDWFLRRLGARRVIGIDLEPARLAVAPRMGATHTVDARQDDPRVAVRDLTHGQMADVVVEAAGELETINLAPKLARERGQLLFFGIPRGPETFPFDYYDFFRRYLRVISSSGADLVPGLRRTYELAIDIIRRGEIDVSPLISHRLPFTEAGVQRAFRLAHNREDDAVRVLIC